MKTSIFLTRISTVSPYLCQLNVNLYSEKNVIASATAYIISEEQFEFLKGSRTEKNEGGIWITDLASEKSPILKVN
jgi:hypothetical protein